jgi:hypothetical protein
VAASAVTQNRNPSGANGEDVQRALKQSGRQMDVTLGELLRLIELVLICQIPAWTLLLGYFLSKR